MADYIPGGDAAFNAWLDNFVTYATANLANLGLVAGDLTPVTEENVELRIWGEIASLVRNDSLNFKSSPEVKSSLEA